MQAPLVITGANGAIGQEPLQVAREEGRAVGPAARELGITLMDLDTTLRRSLAGPGDP